MPSPFPGMDPYIEDFTWPEFHASLAVELRNHLVKYLPQELTVDFEVTVATESLLIPLRSYRPDLAVKREDTDHPESDYVNDTGTVTTLTITPPTQQFLWRTDVETVQRTLLVRSVTGGKLVAAIEILSPANKRGEGLAKYRRKCHDYRQGGVHLLEIDLLREGIRPETTAGFPPSTYRILTDNVNSGTLMIWALGLDDALPTVALPLLPGMSDLPIDLASAFIKIYQEAGYEKRLNYSLPLKPALAFAADQRFLDGLSLT